TRVRPFRTLFERDEDAVPQLAAERLRQMSLAVRVFDEKDFAGADAPRLAVARRDLHAGIEIDDVLAARRWMPVEVVVGLDLTEDDARRRHPLREPPRAGRLRVLDLDVLEVRFAVLVRVEPMDLHGALLRFSWGGPMIVRRPPGGKSGRSVYTPADGHETGGRSHRSGRTPARDARDGAAARARGVHRALLPEPGRWPGALRGAGPFDRRDRAGRGVGERRAVPHGGLAPPPLRVGPKRSGVLHRQHGADLHRRRPRRGGRGDAPHPRVLRPPAELPELLDRGGIRG